MELKRIDCKLTVCKVTEVSSINLESDFYFIGKTDEEVSLVCKTEDCQNFQVFLQSTKLESLQYRHITQIIFL
jgi:hypothetical protein